MAFLGGNCKTGSPPVPPTPDEPPASPPAYELTAGDSLYDDFDGHGNFQTLDGQDLASAGKLSSKIWAGTFGTEMLTYPVPSRPFTVVDEDGRRVEYGTPDPAAGAPGLSPEFPRPVTALEKAFLDKLLNERGRAVAADLDTALPEHQIKVLGYLLARKGDVLNEAGRKFPALLTEPSAPDFFEGRLAGLLNPGFDESEKNLIAKLAAEVRAYDRIEDSPLRTALRNGADLVRAAAGRSREYSDVEYVFDAEGRLLDAVPHAAGRPYHGSRRLLFRGAADVLLETPTGPLLIEKGKLYGAAEAVSAQPGGTILKVTNALEQFHIKILPSNPEVLDFPEFKSFSADVMLSSASTGRNCAAGLDFHTTIPEQPPGKSWWAQIVIVHGITGETFLLGQYTNINMGYSSNSKLAPAALDQWFNLRMDVVTRQEDARLRADEIRLDFYVDGAYKASLYPEDSPILLDPQRTGLGPHRTLVVYSEDGSANTVGYFDNIHGVYKNRTR